jgi:DNA primase
MKYFNSQILDEIKSVLDISILVERFVPLKKTGSRYIGICPFHQDTKPSMYVTPSMGIYKCFACGAGGDHFKFVQEYEKLDFPTAVETVAEIAGYKLPEKKMGKEEFKSAQEKKSLLDINFTASHFFQDQLFKNQDAYKYLSSRGLLEPTIKTFQLGWAPQSWDALIKHGQKKWSLTS